MKKKLSLKVELLFISVIPCTILAIILCVFSATTLIDGMQTELLKGLHYTAASIDAGYNAVAPGDYSLADNGDLMKGDVNITENESLIDSFVTTEVLDVAIYYGDTCKATTITDSENGSRILGSQAPAEITDLVINQGQVYTSKDAVAGGSKYYACYIPVKNSDDKIVGMIFTGETYGVLSSYTTARIRNLLLAALAVMVVISIVIFLISKTITSAITDTEEAILQLSEGNLNVRVKDHVLKRPDEIGVMGYAVGQTISKLKEILSHISHSSAVLSQEGVDLGEVASHTSNSTDEISHAVEEISRGAITQAEEVESATNLVADMGSEIEQIVQSIDVLYAVAEKMQKASEEAQANMNLLKESNEQTTTAIEKVAENVQKTDKSVSTISDALNMITDIADETNLLSLNASIEAARAGEAGRGFAVVAAQIQKLAEESSASAAQIAEIIGTLSRDSANTLAVMNKLKEYIVVQQEKMLDTMEKFSSVREGIISSTEHTKKIHSQASDCDTARISVVDIIQDLSALSEENAASTQQTNASMQELNATISVLNTNAQDLKSLAESLEEDMKFFKL